MIGRAPALTAAVKEAARLAPSADNSQPWKLRWEGETLRIDADPDRAKSYLDADFSMWWIATGALTLNIAWLARSEGWETVAEPLEGTALRLRFEESSPARHELADALPKRHTNRRRYSARALPADFLQALRGFSDGGARIILAESKEARDASARALAAFDPLLFAYESLHAGLFRWLRWTETEVRFSGDGMSIESLEMNPFERWGFRQLSRWPVARFVSRCGLNAAFASRAAALYRSAPVIAWIAADAAGPHAYLSAGRLLQHAWALAAHHGLSAQPIAGMPLMLRGLKLGRLGALRSADQRRIESHAARLRATPSFGDALPCIALRLGYAPPPSARSVRRDTREWIVSEETHGLS